MLKIILQIILIKIVIIYSTTKTLSQQIPYRHFTIRDGLPASQINALYEDSRGYIWVGTYDGFAYCDGQYIYNLSEKIKTPHRSIGNICEDTKGNIWFNSLKYLSKFDGNTISFDTSKFHCIDSKFIIDKQNIKWTINNLDSMLYNRYENGNWQNVHSKVGLDSKIKLFRIYLDQINQRILVSDYNNNLYEISKLGISKKLNCVVNPISFFNTSQLFFPKNDSIFKLIGDNLKFILKTNTKEIHHVVESNGIYYFGSNLDSKLYIQNPNGKKDSIDVGVPINLLLNDKDGRIWVGTENGLFCFFPNGFYSFDEKLQNIWAIAEGKNESVLFASYYNQNLIYEYSNGKLDTVPNFYKFSKSKEGLGPFYFGGTKDDNENVYFPMNTGIMKYDGKKFENLHIRTPDNPTPLAMYCFNSNDKKTIYVCTRKGIIQYDTHKKLSSFIEMDDLKFKAKWIFGGCEDKDGNIWGSSMNTIFRYNTISKIVKSYTFNEFGQNAYSRFISISSDNKGNIWVAHNKGLLKLNYGDSLFKPFLPDANYTKYWAIKNYKDKILILGALDAVYLFDLKTYNENGNIILKKFNYNNGFNGLECAQNGILIDSHDNLYLAASNTVFTINLQKVDMNIKPSNLYIVEINNQRVPYSEYGKSFSLNYGINNVKMKFETVGADKPTDGEYSYRIDNENWSPWLSEDYAFVENLPSGTHHFSVRTRPMGNPDESQFAQTSINIIVNLPFYKEPNFPIYAGLGIGILTMLIVFGIYNSRKNKQLAEKNIQLLIHEKNLKESQQSRLISYLQVQSLQSQLNPHFVFNALDVVNNKIKEERIDIAGELIVDLSKLMRRFLESSIHLDINDQKTEHTLKDELGLLDSYIRFEQLQYDKFDYNYEISENIDPDNTFIPPMLIQPYIENVIKHGLMYKKDGRGKLQLTINKSENETIICQIIDNGVGRKVAKAIQESHLKMYKSRGTEIVEKRIKVMQELGIGITIHTEDLSTGGTKVIIEIDV